MATLIESPLTRLTPEQIEQLGREFDAIHDEVKAELGDRDRRYITSMIEMHRRLVVLARVLLLASRHRPAWIAGTTTLSLAKILENMEIGHNVMHGQWDWMNDPQINSSTWDWDSASTPEAWKHSHNYVHHTYTNIRGKDRDLGYEIMRIDPHQKWNPVYLFQPFYNLVLAGFFEWGVAAHDLDFDAIRSGEKSKAEVKRQLKGMAGKARSQIVKDYVAWPLISGLAMAAVDLALEARAHQGTAPPGSRSRQALAARSRVASARSARRRRRTSPPTSSATSGPTRSSSAATSPTRPTPSARRRSPTRRRARWYIRQLLGAANIEGSPLFHVISGNLGYQVEHHLFPDMPSTRYAEIAPRVREICERYELPYNTGPFSKQLGTVQRTILRLAFPGGKPGPSPVPTAATTATSPTPPPLRELPLLRERTLPLQFPAPPSRRQRLAPTGRRPRRLLTVVEVDLE